MLFTETPLKGAFLITPEPATDERGLFARTYCEQEFAKAGLHTHYPQCNTSFNAKKGTLRGLHYQAAPHEEVKIVRCTAGEVFDVIVDLRKGSATHLKWHGVTLSAENRQAVYVPKGFAHGFLTLCDRAEVFYMMGEFYRPEAARGVRWDDPALGIEWPQEAQRLLLSPKDKSYRALGLLPDSQ